MLCVLTCLVQNDREIAFHALEHDFVLVTNNAVDFRAIYAKQDLFAMPQGIRPPKRAWAELSAGGSGSFMVLAVLERWRSAAGKTAE